MPPFDIEAYPINPTYLLWYACYAHSHYLLFSLPTYHEKPEAAAGCRPEARSLTMARSLLTIRPEASTSHANEDYRESAHNLNI